MLHLSWDLVINIEKPQYICEGEEITGLRLDNNKRIAKFKIHKYLGKKIHKGGTDDAEME